jgi:hypothetical protein
MASPSEFAEYHNVGSVRRVYCDVLLSMLQVSHTSAKYYQHDVKYILDGIEARKLYPLWAALDHVDRLETCLASRSPWETLSEAFPELLEIQEEMVQHDGGNPLDIQNAYVRMYRTYVAEWRSFPLGSLAATA